MNKYKHEFTIVPAAESQRTLNYVKRVLKEERGIVFAGHPLETSRFQVENIKWAFVFYEDGLAVNVQKFKFARQKSKLAGTIRGSFFVIKGEY